MELTIFERLILLGVLPKEGNFTTLKIVRKLREDLSFSEEEHKTLNIRQQGDQVFWDDKDYVKDIAIGEKAVEIVADTLKKLSDSNKLNDQLISVYEKFVIGKEE